MKTGFQKYVTKHGKRVLSLFVVFWMLCSLIPANLVSAANGDTLEVSVSCVGAAEAGDYIYVDISITDSPAGAQALFFGFEFDSSLLEVDSITSGGLMDGWLPNPALNPLLFHFFANPPVQPGETGVLATIRFRVLVDFQPDELEDFALAPTLLGHPPGWSNATGTPGLPGSLILGTECTWGDWVVTTPPECGVPGVETRTCEQCGEEETRPVDALEHNWSDWVETTPPACGVPGVETRTCSHCQATETRAVDALDHILGAWIVVTPSVCGTPGLERRECQRAGCDHYETRVPAALNCDWGAWVVTTPPTCCVDGEETRTCGLCQATDTRPVDALGSNPCPDCNECLDCSDCICCPVIGCPGPICPECLECTYCSDCICCPVTGTYPCLCCDVPGCPGPICPECLECTYCSDCICCLDPGCTGQLCPGCNECLECSTCTCPSLTLTVNNVTIDDANLTRNVTVGGTATGAITLSYTAPAGVTVAITGGVITVTGVRPAFGQPAITGDFVITVTRNGHTALLTVTVNLTALAGGGGGGGIINWPPQPPQTPPLADLEDPPLLYDMPPLPDLYDIEEELFLARFIVGYPDGYFVPAGSITRAETAALIVRTLTTNFGVGMYQTPGTTPMFSDVSPDAWYFGYIAAAYRYGLVLGFPDGSFGPNLPITREQFAALIARTTVLLSNGVLPYTDADDISYWAVDYVYTVLVNNWMHGDTDGTFRPLYTIRRAEAVAAICRILERTNTTSQSFSNVADYVTIFPDVSNPGTWYFYYVVDATNSRWFITDGQADVWTRVRCYDAQQ